MDANRRDVARSLRDWLESGRACVLATVVSTSGSAPRGLGAQLAIGGAEEWVGALSGGCTEAAVLAEADRLLAGDDELTAAYVAYSKETMLDVGPVCGATLGVVVERVDHDLVQALERSVERAMDGVDAVVETSWIWDGDAPTSAGDVEPGHVWRMRRAMSAERADDGSTRAAAQVVDLQLDDASLRARVLVPSSTHLVLGGGGDIARELLWLAERLAWRVTLVDPRSTIAQQTARSVPGTRLLDGWPDAVWDDARVDDRTACVALAHESHVDEPFLARALESPAFYVGAVGSRRVQAARRACLRQLLGDEPVSRLRGPAGLDLGGHAAAEIALSIASEILAASNERSGSLLTSTDGPIRAT